MRARARPNIEHPSSATPDGDFIQFRKSILIKKLSCIDRRISDAVISAQDTVSIFRRTNQVAKHAPTARVQRFVVRRHRAITTVTDQLKAESAGRLLLHFVLSFDFHQPSIMRDEWRSPRPRSIAQNEYRVPSSYE